MDTNDGGDTSPATLAGVVEGSRNRRRLMRMMMLTLVILGLFSTPAGDNQMVEALKSIAALGTMGSVADVLIPDDIRPQWMWGTDFKDYEFWLPRGWAGVMLSASTALGLGFTLYYGGTANAVAFDIVAAVIAIADMLGMISTMRDAAKYRHAGIMTDTSASASETAGPGTGMPMSTNVDAPAGDDTDGDHADADADHKGSR